MFATAYLFMNHIKNLLEFVFDHQLHKLAAKAHLCTECPKKFTKTLMPALKFLTVNWKILVTSYIDDLIGMIFSTKFSMYNICKSM